MHEFRVLVKDKHLVSIEFFRETVKTMELVPQTQQMVMCLMRKSPGVEDRNMVSGFAFQNRTDVSEPSIGRKLSLKRALKRAQSLEWRLDPISTLLIWQAYYEFEDEPEENDPSPRLAAINKAIEKLQKQQKKDKRLEELFGKLGTLRLKHFNWESFIAAETTPEELEIIKEICEVTGLPFFEVKKDGVDFSSAPHVYATRSDFSGIASSSGSTTTSMK